MKTIRLSHKAADYIRQESAYLKDRSRLRHARLLLP